MAVLPHAYGSANTSSTSTSTFTLSTLKLISDGTTGYSPVTGDLILVWVGYAGSLVHTQAELQVSANQFGNLSPVHASVINSTDTVKSSAQLWYFQVGATPDTTLTLPACVSSSDSIAVQVYVIKGHDTTTPFAGVTPTTAGGINGALPDCPSITTAAVSGCLIAGFACQAQATGAALTAPTTTPFDATARYTNFVNRTASTNDVAVGSGFKTGVAASTAFDASAFGGGTTAVTASAAAVSVVIQPSSGGGGTIHGTGSGTLGLTGSASATHPVKGASSGALSLSGSAAGKAKVKGAAAPTLTLTGSATATHPVRAAGAGSIGFSGTAAGKVKARGAASGAISILGGATAGRIRVSGATAGTLALSGAATGTATIPVTGVASGVLALGGLATMAVYGWRYGTVPDALNIISPAEPVSLSITPTAQSESVVIVNSASPPQLEWN